MFGYTGKILRIDLTRKKVEIEEKDELFYRKYIGGACIGVDYLLRELKPYINPFSEENLL